MGADGLVGVIEVLVSWYGGNLSAVYGICLGVYLVWLIPMRTTRNDMALGVIALQVNHHG